MSTNFESLCGPSGNYRVATTGDLFFAASTRELEAIANQQLVPHALMHRAGLALARFAMATCPHSKVIWIACGPGNNGGDGLEAAVHLRRWGKHPVVSLYPHTSATPPDAANALKQALATGVAVSLEPPARYDLCIDAIFGIGNLRSIEASTYRPWIVQINKGMGPTIAADIPSGLMGDTGAQQELCVHADYTLSLLTLKPGLFTHQGRDACGEIWHNALQTTPNFPADAQLNPRPACASRAHASHKGSYGDVAVVGGSRGMEGAVTLAARAALHAGAGRVFVATLSAPDSTELTATSVQPELMHRTIEELPLDKLSIVAGCGGGSDIARHLPVILQHAKKLVLDADGLNGIANDSALGQLVRQRATHSTIITPHPLEAARLLNTTVDSVQSNRLQAAKDLAQKFACIVVLKGNGTIVCMPGTTPRINTTGNARLATAGTGDVLAGTIGANIAVGNDIFEATCRAVYRHGEIADTWQPSSTMTALDVALAF